ncbi:putative methyltransferase-domain-containing protein [Geranomyces variabilis]|nr:putative methyltransferase-domain-containing protein [Geranomyces variabilis]KAJ3143416.1 hypothetical protein HDU90_000176 [Geranomyces variabilis]
MTNSITITKSSDREYLYHNISLPPHKLTIASRLEDPSSDDDTDFVDPYLFDPSYTLAAATGFSVWEGAITLLSFLHSSSDPAAHDFRRRVVTNREKILELGSGTGIGGVGIAALGGDVLLTDVDSVCDITRNNVARNLPKDSSSVPSGWKAATRVGLGTAAVQTLDWSVPVSSQIAPNDPRSAPLIVAAEVAWLVDLVPCFVQTLADLLRPHAGVTDKTCYWAYKERGVEGVSKMFTTMPRVMAIFRDLGCEVSEVWREESREDPGKYVIVNIVKMLGGP